MSTTKYSPFSLRNSACRRLTLNVVEEDVAVGMPPGGCDWLIQAEPRSSVGAAPHDKHCRAARRPFVPELRLGGAIGRSVELAEEVGAEAEVASRVPLSVVWSLFGWLTCCP